MAHDNVDEVLAESTLTRRTLLRRSAQGAAALSLGGLVTAGPAFGRRAAATETVRWISPRGTLEVMDDYNLWIPIKMGYFKELGINAKLIAGPLGDALATAKFVGQNQADMGYPSPGVLTAAIDAGVNVKMIWDMISGQVFDFALPLDSPIKNPKQLAGKRIALGSAGWSAIVNPMLVELGIKPSTVKYVTAGAQWGQAAEQGRADAALSWQGLNAQWKGQGLKLKFLIGTTFSKLPSNGYCVRSDDLADAGKSDLYTRFLQGMIMGLEFARANPRAAAQITYGQFPGLRKTLKPQAAFDSFLELARAYGTSNRAGQGWGWNYVNGWSNYLKIVADLGQTKKRLPTADVITNELLIAANKQADRKRAIADAKAFKLNSTWQAVKVNPAIKI
jgi:NitT/TauT family transport system substrate-binding protein